MTVLLYFVSLVSLVALFASAIAGTLWVLTRFIRAFRDPPATAKRRRESAADFHHLKRAGQ
jgi:hypothetical protein